MVVVQNMTKKQRVFLVTMIKHDFTDKIIAVLNTNTNGEESLKTNELIQYLNIKTKAANRGSKSRAGFANHYAIYVLIEDYINGDFNKKMNTQTMTVQYLVIYCAGNVNFYLVVNYKITH